MVKRKRCNFQVPKPFIILSSNGLKRNGLRRYIIYQDLSNFRAACRRCKFRRVVDKRSSCAIGDPDFMLKHRLGRVRTHRILCPLLCGRAADG